MALAFSSGHLRVGSSLSSSPVSQLFLSQANWNGMRWRQLMWLQHQGGGMKPVHERCAKEEKSPMAGNEQQGRLATGVAGEGRPGVGEASQAREMQVAVQQAVEQATKHLEEEIKQMLE
ncbi:hypothetical protein HaLaN_27961, partial [Haematococcus lacustris]